MGTYQQNRLTLFLTLLVVLQTIVLLLQTYRFSIGLLLLSCFYVIIVLVRNYVLKIDLRRIAGFWYLHFQLVWALAVFIQSESFFAQIATLILIGEFTFYRQRMQSFIFTTTSYVCTFLSIMIIFHFPPISEIYFVLPRVVEFYAIFGISVLAKTAFQQKKRIADDFEQLQIASIELERKAKLQERTRISREIHDSVGHALTSVLTGLQTAASALEKNHYSLAQEMVNRAREQILFSLEEVRSSVQLLYDDHSTFMPKLIGLIEETKKLTHVEITYTIDRAIHELPPLLEITIHRALQEGLTNGIRHGSCTAFHFSLTLQNDYIRFELSDNGQAHTHIVYGFGLNAMKERVEELGGEMSISNRGNVAGVNLEIFIPYQTKNNQAGEQNV